jgi:uncharacterized repeat protein (TIGR03803 family)
VLATGFQIGANPNGPLIADAAGNLYGTATTGEGYQGLGGVFKVTPAGVATVLYTFTGANSDGFLPFYTAGLVADAAGNLYGTTQYGGTFGWGTVYKLTPPVAGSNTWSETVLYSFTGGNDGAYPVSSLILEAKGNLYGTTPFGGSSGFGQIGSGTVYELTPPSTGSTWSETVLHAFVGSDGARPISALTADSAGNLYGTTALGGSTNLGTVFKIVLPATFNGIPGQSNCYGQSISFLAQEYGGIAHAAATLGYSSVAALQSAVTAYCGGN